MNGISSQSAPLPWSLVVLWFFYYLSIPAKGVIFVLAQILLLGYVAWNIKSWGAMVRSHYQFIQWQMIWVLPVVLVGVLHFPDAQEPRVLAEELLLFFLRALVVALALMLAVNQQTIRIKTMLMMFLLAMLVHSLSMYWQWYSGWDFTYRVPTNVYSRLSGSVFNANPFGLFMAIAMILAGYYAFVSKGLMRLTSSMLIVVFALSLYKSESRGAMLGLLVAMLTITLSLPYSRTWRWLLILMKLFVAGLAVWGFSLNLQRPDSDDVRWSALQEGFKRSFDSPWIGCGWQCTDMNAIVPGADGVHNVFLDVALLTGWPCALIFIASLGWLFYITRKSRCALANTLRAMLALLLAAGLFDYSVLTSKMYHSALICLGILFWLSVISKDNQENRMHEKVEGPQQ